MLNLNNTIRTGILMAAALFPVGWLADSSALYAQAKPAATSAKDFAGTWNWMFQDKRFATMTLEQRADGLAGTITNVSIELGKDGKIAKATSHEGEASITRASVDAGVLHIFERDGEGEIEFAMTLISDTTAELRFVGADAPPNAEPIHLARVWSEPPVQP
jgi:hypothetical protein